MTRNPLRPNVAQKFDYCKMVENVFGDISENLNSENENSEVNYGSDGRDDTMIQLWKRYFSFI